jgi:hypothetical protein
MPIDLCSSINKISHYAFGSSVLNGVLGSSIFVAVLITLVMTVLIMIMYPAKRGTKFTTVGKMGIYMFFITLLIVFLHDSVIRYISEDLAQSRSENDFIKGFSNSTKDVVYGNYESILPEPRELTLPINATTNATTDTKTNATTDTKTSTSTNTKPVDGSSECYTGSIVSGGNFGILGGSYAPKIAGNPYD